MKIYVSLAIVMLVVACQRDVDQIPTPAQQCKVTKMIRGVNNGTGWDTVFTFYYDNNDRLEKIHDSHVPEALKFVLHYDVNGRLVKVDDNQGADFYPSRFVYTSAGRLKEIHGMYSDSAKTIFEYGTDTLPVGSKEYIYRTESGQWELYLERQYTYHGGNLVKILKVTPTQVPYEEATYTYYDTIPNKLGNLALVSVYSVSLGYRDAYFLFSKNMVKEQTYRYIISDPSFPDYPDSYHKFLNTYQVVGGRMTAALTYDVGATPSDTARIASRFFTFECK